MKFCPLRSLVLFSLASAVGLSVRAAEVQASESPAPEAAVRTAYILQPQDIIRVHVFQEEDINKQTDNLTLSQESTITLPLIGTISLQGKTVRQAEEIIRDLYDRDYIVNPQVGISVLKYVERTVNVIGSVTSQGRIQFPQEQGLNIVQAISLAGGQTRLADLRHVKLTRKNASGETEVMIVDVDAMAKSGRNAISLQPDDIIFVPERML